MNSYILLIIIYLVYDFVLKAFQFYLQKLVQHFPIPLRLGVAVFDVSVQKWRMTTSVTTNRSDLRVGILNNLYMR